MLTKTIKKSPKQTPLVAQAQSGILQRKLHHTTENPLHLPIWQREPARPIVRPLPPPHTGHNFSRIPVIQPKLTLGQPNDKYEQEADRVADQVMRMPDHTVATTTPQSAAGAIQRACASCAEEYAVAREARSVEQGNLCPQCRLQTKPLVQQQTADDKKEEEEEGQTLQASSAPGYTPSLMPGIASGIHAMQGGGQPLGAEIRGFMEPRFGRNFGQVRIHADTNAARISRQINARAFTFGRHIAFGAGQYQPNTPAGRKLLAHELTHVVQQSNTVRKFTPNNDQLLNRAVGDQYGQATSGSTRHLISDLTSPIVVGSQPLFRIRQHGAEVGPAGARETYRWQVHDRTTNTLLWQTVTTTPELRIPATTAGNYRVSVTVLINGNSFTTLSLNQDVVAEDAFLTGQLATASTRGAQTYRELVNDFKGYIIDAANTTGANGITPRMLASVLFVEVSNRPKAGRETELEDVRGYLNTQQRGGVLLPWQKVDRSVGVGQIRSSTAAMALGITPWVNQTPGNRSQGRQQTEANYAGLTGGQKFAILELLRWPKSNIRVAATLLSHLKNRSNRYPTLTRAQFVANQRATSIVASEYNLGPSDTAETAARPSSYGNWVWNRMTTDPIIIHYFPNT